MLGKLFKLAGLKAEALATKASKIDTQKLIDGANIVVDKYTKVAAKVDAAVKKQEQKNDDDSL